jgi:hypothetical protein
MQIRDRIKELRRVRASQLRPSPSNWRTHPQAQQDALQGILAEIGYADALLARELEDGTLELIDGHLRAETTPDMEVPVLVLDVTEAEAKKILATLDPLAAMAEVSAEKLDALLQEVDNSSVTAIFGDLQSRKSHHAELKQLSVAPPPRMSWVLIGIPTLRFGEIADSIERLTGLPDIILETTANDGPNSD